MEDEYLSLDQTINILRRLLDQGEYDVIRTILVESDYPDVLNICATATELRVFCDDYLYQLKAEQDYGVTEREYSDNWTDEYARLYLETTEVREFGEAMWEVEDVLSEKDLNSRSKRDLMKVAKYFGVTTRGLDKDRLVDKLLLEVDNRGLFEQVDKYPLMKSYRV